MPARRGGVSVRSSRAGAVTGSRRGDVSPQLHVAEMQRSRLLAGAVRAVDEQGYSHVTVAHISARTRVSRRTFYALFSNREDCLLAVLHDAVARIEAELSILDLNGLPWRERLRTGLWTVLCFFDREPATARFCVVQSARGGERVLAYREELLARLIGLIDDGRYESARAGDSPQLTAEGLAGAMLSILYTRLLKRQREPFSDLLGELMALIVLPYLGPAAASRERTRPAPPASPLAAGEKQRDKSLAPDADPLKDIPMRLTYRTALVLEDVAEHPGVSNRAIADHVGIADQGQASKLLARLERLGLISNTGRGQAKGESNEWWLTPNGEQVESTIRAHTNHHRPLA